MWRQIATVIEPDVPQGATKVAINELQKGEIFAINAKAQRFALKRFVMENGQLIGVVANSMTGPETMGTEIMLNMENFGARPVLSWGLHFVAAHESETQHKYEPFDRIVLLKEGDGKISGTVIDLNNDKFPDHDIIILWDQVYHGKWIDECPIHAIKWAGQRASGPQLQIAKAVRPIVRELREEHHKQAVGPNEPKPTRNAQEAKERQEYQEQLTAAVLKQAEDASKKVLAEHAKDAKLMVDACLITVTAGEFNYQYDKTFEILSSHLENVDSWIRPLVEDPIVRAATVDAIFKRMNDLVRRGYFLIRQGYIKELPNGGFAVYSTENELLGKFPTRNKAIAKIKSREWKIRHGYGVEEGV